MAGHEFSKIMKLMKSQRFFFFFFEFVGYCFGELGPNHVSKFQVRTRKMSAAQRYWLVLSVMAGPACSRARRDFSLHQNWLAESARA